MARVTVEDCIERVPNRFELVLLASHRARTISQGAPLTVDRDNDKNPVVALREIAESTVDKDDLKEDLIHSMQKHVEVDEPEPEAAPLMSPEALGAQVVLGEDSEEGEAAMDRMTEEDLLRGLEGLPPLESSDGGSRSGL